MALPHPQGGDVLVTKRTATVEHDVSVLPGRPYESSLCYANALAAAKGLAEQIHVDAWFTEDHTHFLRIASFRT